MFNEANSELHRIIVQTETTIGSITASANREERSRIDAIFFEEIDDLLLMSSISMTSLIDICRRLTRKYVHEDFFKKFEKSNDAIKTNPTGVFLKQFRNFIIHGSRPPLGLISHFDGETDVWTTCYVLELEPFKEFLTIEQTKELSIFLSSREEVHLSSLVKSYSDSMRTLWSSFLSDFSVFVDEAPHSSAIN